MRRTSKGRNDGEGVSIRARAGLLSGYLLVGLAAVGCGAAAPGLAVAPRPVTSPDTGAGGPRRDRGLAAGRRPERLRGAAARGRPRGGGDGERRRDGASPWRRAGGVWDRGSRGPDPGFRRGGGSGHAATGPQGRLSRRARTERRPATLGAPGRRRAYTPLVAGDVRGRRGRQRRVMALDAATGGDPVEHTAGREHCRASGRGGQRGPGATRADTLYHLEPASGAILARTPLGTGVRAARHSRRRDLVPLYTGEVAGYDPVARVIRWRAEVGAPALARRSSPATATRVCSRRRRRSGENGSRPGSGAAERVAEQGARRWER